MTPRRCLQLWHGVLHVARLRQSTVSLMMSAVLHSPRTSLTFLLWHPSLPCHRPGHQGNKARSARPLTQYDCVPGMPIAVSGITGTKEILPTRVHVAAKACRRCYTTLGSRYCCSSPQSKSRSAVIAVVVGVIFSHSDTSFTPAASAAATCTTTFTSTNNTFPFCTAL